MATIGTRLFTWLHGEEVGRDAEGNRYYRHKKGGTIMSASLQKERRWVIYAGEDEASRVPPGWNSWLHHTTDKVPPADGAFFNGLLGLRYLPLQSSCCEPPQKQ